MVVERHDAAASGNTDNQSYDVTAAANRLLILGITNEGGSPTMTVTYGGQSMTELVTRTSAGGTNRHKVDLFYLLEAGIAARSGNVIAVTGQLTKWTWSARSYKNVLQDGGISTFPSTGSNTTGTSSPNPVKFNISVTDGDAAVAEAQVAQICAKQG